MKHLWNAFCSVLMAMLLLSFVYSGVVLIGGWELNRTVFACLFAVSCIIASGMTAMFSDLNDVMFEGLYDKLRNIFFE